MPYSKTRAIEPDTGKQPGDGLGALNLYYRLPVVLLCTGIFWQSCYASLGPVPLFPHGDKVAHLMVYGLLAFVAARWLSREKRNLSPGAITLLAAVFAIGYGITDEIHQGFVPGRDASFLDLAADGLGAVAGSWAFCFFWGPKR